MEPNINKIKKQKNKLDKSNINYYSTNFKNTLNLPYTQSIISLLKNFKKYEQDKLSADSLNTPVLNLNDCFLIQPNMFQSGLRHNNINVELKMNPKTPLDKLINYCFYIKQPTIFSNPNNKIITLIKYQIGKDVVRDSRNINGKLYDQEYYASQNKNNYEIADLFYQNIIDKLYEINQQINLDIVNKIALLSVQNVYGLISDMLTIQMFKILEPEIGYIYSPDKYVNIVINKEHVTMEFNFKCKLLITKDKAEVNVEYPCGDMEFIFFVDILNNIYSLKKFTLNYDIDKCGPESTPTQIDTNKTDKFKKSAMKPEVMIPAAITATGLVSAPFLLAFLGGKKRKTFRRKQKKRRKTVKRRY